MILMFLHSPINNKVLANTTNGRWDTTQVVSTESTGLSVYASMAKDSKNNIHVVWQDRTDYNGAGTDSDIFYKYFDQSTKTWSTTQVVSTESNGSSSEPVIAIDSKDNVHVVWWDTTNYQGAGTDYDIFYKYLDHSTGTWSTTQVVSTVSNSSSAGQAIAIDSKDRVHVVWYDATNYQNAGTDYDIFYRYLDQSTGIWSTTQVLSNESTADSINPTIAIDSKDNIHVAWYDATNYNNAGTDDDIFYKYFDASTGTWSALEVISTESTGTSLDPAIAIDSKDNVHVVWQDRTDYNGAGTDPDIFYKYFNYSSNVWTTTQVVSTESIYTSAVPRIACDTQGNVHVVWSDITDYNGAGLDSDIFYKTLDISSMMWSGLTDVSSNSGNADFGSISIDTSGRAYVLWHDSTDYLGSGTDNDIFFREYEMTPNSPHIQLMNQGPEYSTIGLSWQKVPFALSYNVYRTNSTLDKANLIGTTTHTTFIDTTTTQGAYSYYVTAQNKVGQSSMSNVILVSISRDTVTQILSGANVTISGENITITHKSGNGFVPISQTSVFTGIFIAALVIKQKRSRKK